MYIVVVMIGSSPTTGQYTSGTRPRGLETEACSLPKPLEVSRHCMAKCYCRECSPHKIFIFLYSNIASVASHW
ncbi:hypothetical protein BJY00DRAFT_273724 [Aspergillus carlsbadensis]|nr:hypothetical protein BJY00DRAFT_273724 [Aspergillus carlsbadensis]